ncbi:uncharacterized protein SOCEGT47_075820 [Sorangium cellulosum]|uniref:Uncharacterized protein n=1 Tax=Sorangium cellulosum TaxID=56 RepID=A0A4P2QBM0_SORCE|nr:uncharacterized protein SOCEGT47_075820 [Sorangium cellulosum]
MSGARLRHCGGDQVTVPEHNAGDVRADQGNAHLAATKCGMAPALQVARSGNKSRGEPPSLGFRLEDRGRLVGEAWIPKAGLSVEEFATCVRQVAVECDRLEYLLTGKDAE